MLPTEIRDKMMAGEISPDQARELFDKARQSKTHHPPPMKNPLQINSRQALASYSPRMGASLQQIDAENFYKRSLVEERVRHGTALILYGVIGAIDGILDATAYGVSEIAEDITFGVTRVIYRAKDGIQRGKL